MLGVCCVLHNVCEMRNVKVEAKLKLDVFDDEVIPNISLRSMAS